MWVLTARWLKNILKLVCLVALVSPLLVWWIQPSATSHTQHHGMRTVTGLLTNYPGNRAIIQTSNRTLTDSSVEDLNHVNRDVNHVNRDVNHVNRDVNKDVNHVNRGVGDVNSDVGGINRGVDNVNSDVNHMNRDLNHVNWDVNDVNNDSLFPVELQDPDHIFFNRVPKCGSTGIKAIFRMLAKLNNWHMVSSKDFKHERIQPRDQEDLVKKFYSLKPPALFERHVNFINFTRFGAEMPFYINVVREPLQRLVSDYYFLRFHLKYMFPMDDQRRKRTYDECVQGNYSECTADGPNGYYRIIPFFCGQAEYCRSPSHESLRTAMQNVEKHYALVGVAEELPGFMQVLEHIAPKYFKHAHATFTTNEEKIKDKYRTRGKLPPQNRTISIMNTKLQYDYEFYYFIRRRFYNTWNKVRLKYNIST